MRSVNGHLPEISLGSAPSKGIKIEIPPQAKTTSISVVCIVSLEQKMQTKTQKKMGNTCGNRKDKLKACKDSGCLLLGAQISVNRKLTLPPAAHFVATTRGSSSLYPT